MPHPPHSSDRSADDHANAQARPGGAQWSASEILAQLLARIDKPAFSVRELMALMGDKGLLMLCAILSLPFLIPVSLPGVSTVFGLAILLIAISVTLQRPLWLPAFVADRQVETARLRPVLQRGVGILRKVDRYLKPQRLPALTRGAMNRINGLVIMVAAVLLMLPLGLVPLSNTLPGIGILLLALGITQRDGLLVLGGHVMTLGSIAYFSALAWAAWRAGTHFLG